MSSRSIRAAERPGPDEYAPFFAGYVARVPDGDILQRLEGQLATTTALLAPLSREHALARPTPDDWNALEVLGHLTDGEQVFAYRALRIGRGDTTPLAGFEQDDYVKSGRFAERELPELLEAYAAQRRATVAVLRSFDDAAWTRRGTVSGLECSARAWAWIAAGHELHHLADFDQRYGITPSTSGLNSKQAALAALHTEFAAWETLLARLDDEQRHTPLAPWHWTVKDVVAHLHSWQEVSQARLVAAVEGHAPVFPAAPAPFDLDTENDIDGINAWSYERDRDVPWATVSQNWRDGFRAVIATAEQIPEADLLDPARYPWMRGYPLIAVLRGTYEHHRDDHREPLEAWFVAHDQA